MRAKAHVHIVQKYIKKKQKKQQKIRDKFLQQEAQLSLSFSYQNAPAKHPNTSRKQQEVNTWPLVQHSTNVWLRQQFFCVKTVFLKTNQNRMIFFV